MPVISNIKNMSKEWFKTYSRTLFRRVVKISAISLFFVAIIFFLYFMKHADEDGMAMYYKITHPLSNYRIFNYRNWLRPRQAKISGYAISKDSIYFSWRRPKSRYVSSFKIERAIKGEKQFKFIARIPKKQEHFKDRNISLGTTYIYSLKVCYYLLCSQPYQREFKTYNPPPPAPSDLEAVVASPNQIDLSWKDNSDYEKGFEIEREKKGKFIKVGKTGPNRTVFSHCPIAPGENYKYRVRAFDGHFHSEDNPTVSITIPDVERVGEIYPIKMHRRGYLDWNGKEWAMVFSLKTEDEEPDKKSKLGKNTEIYFQRLDSEFNPIGDKTRISFDPCSSIKPSLAWNGKEYGVVWSDSRNSKPHCYAGGDYGPPYEVYFARVSAGGKRIGPEVKLLRENKSFYSQRLFWQKDHYALFYTGPKDINYLALDIKGNVLKGPMPAGESIWMWDVTQAGDHFGITWISSNFSNQNILYFLDFNPESKEDIHPIKIAMTLRSEPNEGCLIEDYHIGVPSVFWTGSNYGVCYRNCNADVAMALISPGSREFKTIIALPAMGYQCSTKNKIDRVWLERSSPQCIWNGSEIALLAYQHITEKVYGFSRFAPDGNKIGKTKYLGVKVSSWNFPDSKLYWNQSYYFTFDKDSLIMLKP